MKDLRTDTDSIYEIQVWLNSLHHTTDGELPLVHPDGIYGDETTAAVSEFQRMNGLAQTGEVDFATYELLRAAYARSIRRPMPLYVFPDDPGYRAISGEESELVELSQWILRSLADHHDELSGRDPTGILDEVTEAELRIFQRLHRLEEHGEIDADTWDALALAYDRRVRSVR